MSAYFHFCSNYLSITVGKSKMYNKKKGDIGVSAWATTSDEAFTLLVLENNWQLWLEQAKYHFSKIMEDRNLVDRGNTHDPESPDLMKENASDTEERSKRIKGRGRSWGKRSKYTSSKNNGHQLQGWSEAGKLRFNELMVVVEKDRNNPENWAVEKSMLDKWRSMDGRKRASFQDGRLYKMDRNPGNGEPVTGMTLSAGAKARYGFDVVKSEQLSLGGETNEPDFKGQVPL